MATPTYSPPPQPPRAVADLLTSDERVLWTGTPDASRVLQRRDLLLIPFTLLWTAFSVFWNVSAWSSEAPIFFRLWGLPFLAMGAYLVVGRFFVRARALRSTTYVLTTRRAFVARGSKVTSEPATGGPSSVDVAADRSRATVTYGPGLGRMGGLSRSGGMGFWNGEDLEGRLCFENVRDVDGLIAATKQAAAGAR